MDPSTPPLEHPVCHSLLPPIPFNCLTWKVPLIVKNCWTFYMCVWNYLNRGGRGARQVLHFQSIGQMFGRGAGFVSQPINVFAALIPELIRAPQWWILRDSLLNNLRIWLRRATVIGQNFPWKCCARFPVPLPLLLVTVCCIVVCRFGILSFFHAHLNTRNNFGA